MREKSTRTVNETAERELIDLCKKGDRRAQKTIYERLAPAMLPICIRYMGDRYSAEDILHDGFMTLFSKIGSYKGDGSFEGWAKRIFVTTALMALRKKDALKGSEDLEYADNVTAPTTTALQSIGYKDLMKVISTLPAGYRTVFNMFAIEGYSHEEIADALGISVVTSRSQMSRARAMLDGAVENVPSHIWDDLQRDLDAAQKRRLAMAAWLRRGAICTAAAAAVVAAVVFTGTGRQEIASDAVAIVEEPVYIEEAVVKSNDEAPIVSAKPARKLVKVAEKKEEVKQEPKKQEIDMLAVSLNRECNRVPADVYETGTKNSASGTVSDNKSATEDEMWENYIKEDYFNNDTKPSGDGSNKKQAKKSSASVQLVLGAGTAYGFGKNNESTFGLPASGMIGVKANFARILALEAGVKYSYLTRSFKDGVDDHKVTGQQHYIGIPINLYVSLVKRNKVNFYVWAGGTAEKCIVNKYSAEVTLPESVKGFLYSAGGGLGVEFALTKRLGLYIDPEVRYYFAGSNLPKSSRTDKPLQAGGELGFRIKL